MVHASTFLPTTLGGWAALVAAIASGIASAIGWVNRRHLQEVRVTVNGQLSKVMDRLTEVTEERDRISERKADRRQGPAAKPLPEVTGETGNTPPNQQPFPTEK